MKKPLNYYGFAFDKATDKAEKKHKKKLRKQLRKHGIDQSEVWALDVTIAKFVLPRIKLLRKTTYGYPANLTPEKWDIILKKIQTTFKITATDSLTPENYAKHQEGLDLFTTYYNNLWH